MFDSLLAKTFIQLQVECSQSSSPYTCCTCNELFTMQNARVMALNSQGYHYGDVCTNCISKGSSWITNRLQQQQFLHAS